MKINKKLMTLVLAIMMVMNMGVGVLAAVVDDAQVVETLNNKVKALETSVRDFNSPATSVFGKISTLELEVAEAVRKKFITTSTQDALNDDISLVAQQAGIRIDLESYLVADASATTGTALSNIYTGTAPYDSPSAYIEIKEAAETYLNSTFAQKHIDYVVAEFKRKGSQGSLTDELDTAETNLMSWIPSAISQGKVAKIVQAMKDKERDDFINGDTDEDDTPTPGNPDDPNKPVDPNNPIVDETDEVTENDIIVMDKFGNNIVLELKGIPTIVLPELPAGYSAEIEIRDVNTNKVIAAGKTSKGGELALKDIVSETEIRVAYELVRTLTNKEVVRIGSDVRYFNIDDSTVPVLNYAYVIDGGLIINVSDDSGLSRNNPVVYRSLGDTQFKSVGVNNGYGQTFGGNEGFEDINNDLFGKEEFDRYRRLDENDFRIEVEVPDTLQIVVTDNFGNKLPLTIEVRENNVKLTNNTPKYVDNLIKSVTSTQYKSNTVANLISVTKGTTVNIFEQFQSQILKEFRKFNSFDLVYSTEDGEMLSGSVHKFDEVGLHAITVSHRTIPGEFVAYVNVNATAGSVVSYKVKTEVEVKEDKFKPALAIDAKLAAKAELNPAQFIAVIDKAYVRVDQDVEFGKEKEIAVKIIDLNSGKEYKINFKKVAGGASSDGGLFDGVDAEGRPVKPVVLTDISGHWARNYITRMTNEGIITGYDDNTFGPNNMITVREALAVIGRASLKNPTFSSNVKGTTEIQGWGKTEIDHALQRLPRDIFNGNYERAITREEVAFVVNNVLKFTGNGHNQYISDIEGTIYASDIQHLVGLGVITGFPTGDFRPTLEITRGELVTMIARTPMY